MSESFAFELKLIDSVSANARRAASAVTDVDKAAQKARGSLDFSKENSRIEQSLKKLSTDPKGYVELIKAQKELKEQRNKLLEDAGLKKPESFIAGLTSKFSFAKIASAAAVGELLAEGAFKVGESLLEAAHKTVEVIADGVKDAFKAAAGEEKQRIGERYALGEQGGKEFREDANRFATRTGFDDSGVRRLMIPLRNAGVSQAASRQAFATANDIAVTKGQGGNEQAVAGIIEQFQRIYTKKGIGKKQLVELLGNVGGTIPDFYKELGKKMKISAKKAEKKAEEGGLDPQLLINMITTAQNKKQGGAAGTAGDGFSKSLEDRWRRLKELPEEYYKNLVDSPGFHRASEMLGSLLENLDPEGPRGLRIQAAINSMFESITGVIGNPTDAADKLASGIEQAVKLTSELIDLGKELADAFLPTLDTVQDMVMGLRQTIAVTDLLQGKSGAQGKLDQLAREEAQTKAERFMRGAKRENDKADRETFSAATNQGANLVGNPFLATANAYSSVQERYKKPDSGGKVIHLNVHPGAVVVHGADADSARKVGDHIHREATNALERAAQEQS